VTYGEEPYIDYGYHTNPNMSLASYCNTGATGTSLSDGAEGIRRFLDERRGEQCASVKTILRSDQNDNEFLTANMEHLPFMVHVKAECAESAVNFGMVEGVASTVIKLADPVGLADGSSLGHTAVAYEWNFNTLLVASNSKGERAPMNIGHRSCNGANYVFTNGTCLEGITTVTFAKCEEKEKLDLTVVWVLGGVGGVGIIAILFVACGVR